MPYYREGSPLPKSACATVHKKTNEYSRQKSEDLTVAVKIRMKKMGRRHRPFFRICATDSRAPRDGKVIEELGTYDPMVRETDARAVLKGERIDYWLSVGAQPSDNVRTLIKKYGTNGSHLEAQSAALGRLQVKPQAPPPVSVELPKPEEAPAADAASTATTEKPAKSEKSAESEKAPAEASGKPAEAAAAPVETKKEKPAGEKAEKKTEEKKPESK